MICQMLLQYLDKRFPKGVCIFEILFHASIDEIKTIICSELIFVSHDDTKKHRDQHFSVALPQRK